MQRSQLPSAECGVLNLMLGISVLAAQQRVAQRVRSIGQADFDNDCTYTPYVVIDR